MRRDRTAARNLKQDAAIHVPDKIVREVLDWEGGSPASALVLWDADGGAGFPDAVEVRAKGAAAQGALQRFVLFFSAPSPPD